MTKPTDARDMDGLRERAAGWIVAYTERFDPPYTNTAVPIIRDLLAVLDEQQGVIEKMPVTADGVRIAVGMTLWYVFPKEVVVPLPVPEPHSEVVGQIVLYGEYTEILNTKGEVLSHTNWYSTREAALAVREQAEGGSHE